MNCVNKSLVFVVEAMYDYLLLIGVRTSNNIYIQDQPNKNTNSGSIKINKLSTRPFVVICHMQSMCGE